MQTVQEDLSAHAKMEIAQEEGIKNETGGRLRWFPAALTRGEGVNNMWHEKTAAQGPGLNGTTVTSTARSTSFTVATATSAETVTDRRGSHTNDGHQQEQRHRP